jgi:hypothetical protein
MNGFWKILLEYLDFLLCHKVYSFSPSQIAFGTEIKMPKPLKTPEKMKA